MRGFRTSRGQCRYGFLLLPFDIYLKETEPPFGSLEWCLGMTGFYFVPRPARQGDCGITVVMTVQQLLGVGLFHTYLEVCIY